MSANDLKKVAAGEAFVMPARVYNEMVDLIMERRRRSSNLAGNQALRDTKNGVIRIKNDAGVDLGRGAVLGLDGLAVDAGEGQPAFRSVFSGVVPGVAHRGRFAVLLAPLAINTVGLAAVGDVVTTTLDVPTGGESCRFADISVGETEHMEAASFGAATILWCEGTEPGQHRSIVSLGPFPATFPVALEQVGGSQGTSSVPASWTYDVKDQATDTILSTAVNPVSIPHRFVRPSVGFMIPATHGHAHLASDGTPILSWINEVADQESC